MNSRCQDKDHTARVFQQPAKLQAVIRNAGECGLSKRNHFKALVRIVISQQLSAKAATAIYSRLQDLTNGHVTRVDTVIQLGLDGLRAVGISMAKASTILHIAQRVQSGSLDRSKLARLSDEKLIERISEVKGLGIWSAHMYLIFVIRRTDILPTEDIGIQNAVRRLYEIDPSRRRLEVLARPWRLFRSIACWYLWNCLDTKPTI